MRIVSGKVSAALLSLVVLLGAQACGGGSSTPATTSTFEAAIAGTSGAAEQSGKLVVTIQGAVASSSSFSIIRTAHAQGTGDMTATGVLTLAGGGGTVDLTGTYCSTSGALELTGGGYTFTGAISDGIVAGTYTGADGAGGGFTGLDSTTNTVTVLCGTFERDDHVVSGVWNIVISSDGVLNGIAHETAGGTAVIIMHGTLSGNSIAITSEDGGSASGEISGESYTGTYHTSEGYPGTMQGSASGCS